MGIALHLSNFFLLTPANEKVVGGADHVNGEGLDHEKIQVQALDEHPKEVGCEEVAKADFHVTGDLEMKKWKKFDKLLIR